MSYLSRLLEQRQRIPDILSLDGILRLMTGPDVYTGKLVNPTTALQLTAVYACIRLISETFATLPALVYRRLGNGKTRAQNHSLYSVIHDISNPEQTSVEYRETCQAHLLLYGHSFSEISRNGAGQVKALWPIIPTRVYTQRNARNEIVYLVDTSGQPVQSGQPARYARLSSDRVLHVSAMLGLSPISQARQALGMAMAAEEYGARFFANDSRPGGVLEHPGHLSDEASERLRVSWEASSGLANSHRVRLLEEGMKWQQIGIPPEEAQFLETRKFQVAEIARLFRVPPHMIGDLDRATFSNIEHQSIEFVTHSIRPWLVRWEQAIDKTLLTDSERENYFVEFLVDGLLRGDITSRYTAYATGRQNGWLNADEIREFENMNPIPDGSGETYLINGNMQPIPQPGEVVTENANPPA